MELHVRHHTYYLSLSNMIKVQTSFKHVTLNLSYLEVFGTMGLKTGMT